MEKEEEFLHGYFTFVSQLCFEKAKEHIEKEKEANKLQSSNWTNFLTQLLQIALAEKSYIEIGFLQNKNKGFLRKDNSLRFVYETIKFEIKRIEEITKMVPNDKRLANNCNNIVQFLSARISLIDLYEKIYLMGTNKTLKYHEILTSIQSIILKNVQSFTDISLTPIKAIYSLECEILEQLFKSLTELQRLQFLPSLALIHGAHTRLAAWENKIQYRETWKLGFLKNTQLPALFQWHTKLKGAVLSKFSLFFHDTLASQTASSDMRQMCSKLHYDYYQKMFNFQKKYDSKSIFFLSDNQVSCDTTDYDNFPVIVSCPARPPAQVDLVTKMISEVTSELATVDRVIYKYSSQDQNTYILTMVEPNIYMVLIFDNKKTEKDINISNFITDICTNLRCSKIFISLKTNSK